MGKTESKMGRICRRPQERRVSMGTQTSKPKYVVQAIDQETGEVSFFPYSDKTAQTQDSNFHKVFLKKFLPAMGMIGNQKSKVAYWILKNLNNDNELKYSYRQIAKKTGVSYQTVAKTIRILQDADFLRRSGGDLIVNPDAIFRGHHIPRLAVQKNYLNADNDKRARLKQIQQTINELNREMDELKRQIDMENGN